VEDQYPTISEWVGTAVIVNYSRGPYWSDLEDPYSLARGAIEGREGVFFLSEVSAFGILVQRILRDGQLGQDIHIPWGAIHAVYQLPFAEESDTSQAEH
jgi:hypothetical protein